MFFSQSQLGGGASQKSKSQIKAFTDFWTWDTEASKTFDYLITDKNVPVRVSNLINALHSFLGNNDMSAYLVMMTVRLLELHRVLKNTGSLYLHCDNTASHYLKLVLDSIFEEKNFRNEIVWKKLTATKAQSKYFSNVKDSIFLYSKTDDAYFNPQFIEGEQDDKIYSYIEEGTGRRYGSFDMTQKGQGQPRQFGDRLLEPPFGKHWIWSQENIDKGMAEGRIFFTSSGLPRVKRYLDEKEGNYLGDLWADKEVAPLSANTKERLGYDTQKPVALLERIINASSKEGDIVLDPFCGCGTTIDASETLKRKWVGIDITHLAINLIKVRIEELHPTAKFEVIGEPKDLEGAIELAKNDKYQFQWWALALVRARPINKQKGADKGIDGIIYLPVLSDPKDLNSKSDIIKVLVQVKGGEHIKSRDIRDLKGTMQREGSKFGLFVTLEEPTRPMREEVASAGFEPSPLGGEKIPKLQILTIKELLEGIKPKISQVNILNISYQKPEVSKKDRKEEEKARRRGSNKKLG
jgi:site-specific DNA-methyltransferase (adenine-specific)